MSKMIKFFSALFSAIFLLSGVAMAQEGKVMKMPDGSFIVQKAPAVLVSTGIIVEADVPALSKEQLAKVMVGETIYMEAKKSPIRWLGPITLQIKTENRGTVELIGDKISLSPKVEVALSTERNPFFVFAAISILLLLISLWLIGKYEFVAMVFMVVVAIIAAIAVIAAEVTIPSAELAILAATIMAIFAVVTVCDASMKNFKLFIKTAIGFMTMSSVCMYFLV